MKLAFWLSLVSLIYVYAGFPLLVMIVGVVRRRRVRKQPITPSLSLIVAAYNEAGVIKAKLDNALALDYPRNRLEIIVASDGSTDATEAIVYGYLPKGVRLLSLARRGKIHALNHATALATGEMLVFSDANTMFHPNALRKLAANFADPEVGGVAGNTGYVVKPGSQSSSYGEKLYWRYDTWLKELESQTGNVVAAHGGMYALRRDLYSPLASAAVTDDFAISTAVIVQGYRLVFEREACAYEVAVAHAGREFGRKVRLMTRGLRAVILRKALLNPFRYGFYSLVLFSHKILRRLLPFALLFLFIGSIDLSTSGTLYSAAAVVQACFYSLAAAGYLLKHVSAGKRKILYIPFFYCLANTAALVAIIKLVTGHKVELWQPQRHSAQV
jgi:cellulose synthase/poly-beta-1,6-N-acetylglucosamine synthase-like glycosyltransferase